MHDLVLRQPRRNLANLALKVEALGIIVIEPDELRVHLSGVVERPLAASPRTVMRLQAPQSPVPHRPLIGRGSRKIERDWSEHRPVYGETEAGRAKTP